MRFALGRWHEFSAGAAVLVCLGLPLHADDGTGLFAEQCAACHGADGKARTPAGRKIGAKDLTLSRLSDEEIVRQVSEGTRDRAGKARMPSFKEQLSTGEIQSLVPVVKSFRVEGK